MTRTVRRLVFGLGNPGPEYAGTRHNVGFRVLDRLALHEGLLFAAPADLSGMETLGTPVSCLAARSHAPDALLVKPLSFMNRSGEVVLPLVEWAGASLEDVLVVYDDMDLDVGRLRIRPHGGAGGQNGMRSIIETLGSDRFPRLRMGIGRAPTDAARHVLSRFTPDEEPRIDEAVAEATDAILFWLREGSLEECMTRFHSRWKGMQGERPGPHDTTTETT